MGRFWASCSMILANFGSSMQWKPICRNVDSIWLNSLSIRFNFRFIYIFGLTGTSAFDDGQSGEAGSVTTEHDHSALDAARSAIRTSAADGMRIRNVFDAIGLFLAQLVADIFGNSRTLALRVGQQIRCGHDGSAGQNALMRITQFRHRRPCCRTGRSTCPGTN